MLKNIFSLMLALMMLAFYSPAYSSGHGDEPAEEEEVVHEPEIGYFEIQPDIVTNVASLNPNARLHYLRVKMTLMMEDSEDESILAEVEPAIKDLVITILGSKEFSQVASNDNRENIRLECKKKISSLLNDKFGRPIISDVLFLNYLYQ